MCVTGWFNLLNLQELERWRLYLFSPHHFVTKCLLRHFVSSDKPIFLGQACLIISMLQTFADVCSALGLWCLLAAASPADIALGADSPGGLVLAYMLTTASLVAGGAVASTAAVRAARSGFDERDGHKLNRCELALNYAIAPVCLIGTVLCAYMLLLAPLKLAGINVQGALLNSDQD